MKDTFNTFEMALEESLQEVSEAKVVSRRNLENAVFSFVHFLMDDDREKALRMLKDYSNREILEVDFEDEAAMNSLFAKLSRNIIEAVKKT